jgi:predicted ATPase/class 3 adenylate cyclase
MAERHPTMVTFLFTDVEGSTRLWEARPEAMRRALSCHDRLLRATIEGCGGRVFRSAGDGFYAVFATAQEATVAALAGQRELAALAVETAAGALPLRVRMVLHSGGAEEQDGDYSGPVLNRTGRLLALGHGGQVLLSLAVRELLGEQLPPGCSLLPLGEHRLKDLEQPESVFQLVHPGLEAEFPALRAERRAGARDHLPRPSTSFVGREKELAEIAGLLARTRLLTLTGTGGCGKTRLALEAAHRTEDGEAWLVELAALSDPELVPQAAASGFGVREAPGEPLAQTLAEALRDRSLLLVLDNCEHLVAACAALADTLLRRCPAARLLATSREALGIDGETTYRVPSLSVPDLKQLPPPVELARCEAVRLFIERAAQARPGFALTERNAEAVAQVCCRLDGIPLAIELAAARLRSLPVEELRDRLDDRFRLLTGEDWSALPHRRTLRALIDWSYDLLPPSERALFARLSVFAGGWTLESAEALAGSRGSVGVWEYGSMGPSSESGHRLPEVSPPDPETPSTREATLRTRTPTPPYPHTSSSAVPVLDTLSGLIEKSLVVHDGDGRYRMLETVRQYARDRLDESGEGTAWRARHLVHYRELAETAEPELMGPEQGAWLERLEAEHDNMRAALEWSTSGGDAQSALRLCGAAMRFWATRGYLSEGRRWCRLALERTDAGGRTPARAKAMSAAAGLAFIQGDCAAAQRLYEESLALHRELENPRGIALSLNNLGALAFRLGDYAAARARYEEGLAAMRELGDLPSMASALGNLGMLAMTQGDYVAARSLYEQSLALKRELGLPASLAATLNDLAGLTYLQGDYEAARRLFEESLALRRQLGDREGIALSLGNLGSVALEQGDFAAAGALLREGLLLVRELGLQLAMAESLDGLARLAAAEGQLARAARLWGAAEALREALGAPQPLNEREAYDRQVAAARAAWDAASFAAAWEAGRALPLEQVLDEALGGRPS